MTGEMGEDFCTICEHEISCLQLTKHAMKTLWIQTNAQFPSRIIFRARVAQGSFGVHLAPARVGDILRDRELSLGQVTG